MDALAKFHRFLNADRWRKDAQIIDFHHDSNDHRKSEYVQFSSPFYGPESDFVEGTPKLLQDVELQVDGLTKIFDNSEGRDPLHIAYTEEVAISNSVTETVGESFTFDVTVGSETTISGEYAGASLEQKLTTEVHTGFQKIRDPRRSRVERIDHGRRRGVRLPGRGDQGSPHHQEASTRTDPRQWGLRC